MKTLTRRQFLIFTSLGSLAVIAAAYPVPLQGQWMPVNHYQIPVPHLPKAFSGFRILHLTDLHLGWLVSDEFLEGVISRSNELGADVIVCTGDYVHKRNTTEEIDRVWPLMMKLKAPMGVYSVLGNHDFWADIPRSFEWLDRSGQNLYHRVVSLERGGSRLWLGGAGDFFSDWDGIDELFQAIPEQDCRIVLAHNPDTADEPFLSRVDLMISGHTHGGQVRAPIVGSPIIPVRNKRYDCGLIQTERFPLFISRGIGWTTLPVRVYCSPEIALLELVEKE